MSGPRLYVDIQTIQSLGHGDRGIPRFATDLSCALLAERAPVAAFALNPLVPWPARLHPDLAAAPELTWNTATAFRRALAGGPLVYLNVSPFELNRPVHGVLAAHVVDIPRVGVVHDLIPHLFPELFGFADERGNFPRRYERRVETIRELDLVLTPSESTRRDVIEHWSIPAERIEVIGEAGSPFFVRAQSGEQPGDVVRRALPSIAAPYVLSVSGREPHKNTESLIDAWARLPRSVRNAYQLVVTCRLTDDDRLRWTHRAERLGIGERELIITGYVEDTVLRALYQAASLFVFPSRYEGFGLPVLEAIQCGCPAISSNTSSLPEVLDWPDATFTPTAPESIAGLVERALTDDAYRAELVVQCRRGAQRHTWPRVVQRVLDACSQFSDQPRRRSTRPRIALVGPFPPGRSWTAGYNAQLAERLAPHCDLDCFAEPAESRDFDTRRRAYRMFPAAAFGHALSPSAYHLVLYTIGRDRDTAYRLLTRTYPGVVWLHDLALADRELLARALGVVVDSHDARMCLEAVGLDSKPIWELPRAVSDGARRDPHPCDELLSSFDEIASRVIDIAKLDIEPARPDQALPVPVSALLA
jgi:glycosyltransferase involved in cell wall biosynthesis